MRDDLKDAAERSGRQSPELRDEVVSRRVAETEVVGNVHLRPHHLLCILTFRGVGYSKGFIDNFYAVLNRIRAGSPVVIVTGPDDICATVEDDDKNAHCAAASVMSRDATARAALRDIPELCWSLTDGSDKVIDATLIAHLRSRFVSGDLRRACSRCEWYDLCTSVASANFTDAHL